MVYFKNNQWHICKEKVKYTQHGEEFEQYVGAEGHDWWVDFEQKWEHTDIIEFIPVKHTAEQLQRLEEINSLNIPDGYGELVQNYVVSEIFPNDMNHPLRNLQIAKQQLEQDNYLIDLDFRQSLNEMGVDVNDL